MKKALRLNKETLTLLQGGEAREAVGASTGCPSLTYQCNTTYCSYRVCPAPTLKVTCAACNIN